MKYINENGFIVFENLDIPKDGGIQIELWKDERWIPPCLFPNLTEEELQAVNNDQDWNFASLYLGFVQGYQIRDNRTYWNWFLDFNGIPEQKNWKVRIRRCSCGGKVIHDEIMDVCIEPGTTIFLNNWFQWTNVCQTPYNHLGNWRTSDPTDVPPGWYVAKDEFGYPRLCAFGTAEHPLIEYCPQLDGRFDLYIAWREQTINCKLILPGGITQNVTQEPNSMPTTRFNKELYIGNYSFSPEDTIGIKSDNGVAVNPQRRFGDILYLKLVPAKERKPYKQYSFAKPGQEIVFYGEPYSSCYYHYSNTEEQIDAYVQKFVELGVDKLCCQTGRMGCSMMHYSKLSGYVTDSVQGDDRQKSNGVKESLRRMDVFKVFCEACKRHKIKFIGDIGINSAYVGSALESSYTKQHPEMLDPKYPKFFLDYRRPDVIDFAARQYAEVALEYDVDGISFNYQRYPFGGLSAENIVKLHRRFAEIIGNKRRKDLELHMDIIADLPDFYEALKILLEDNLVDSVTVGRHFSCYPIVDLRPYKELMATYPGKKLYGKIDGWTSNHGGLLARCLPRPAECAELAEAYFNAGADGLYFYQSEQVIKDHFLFNFVKALKNQ